MLYESKCNFEMIMHENNTVFQNNLDPWMCATILNEAKESSWIVKKLQVLCFRIPFFEDSIKMIREKKEKSAPFNDI